MTGVGGYSRTIVTLTPRMRDVIACRARGLTIVETALELGTAEGTVRVECAAAVARAGARNFYELVYMFGRGELR